VNVAVLYEVHFKRYATSFGVAQCCRDGGIWHGYDNIGIDMKFLGHDTAKVHSNFVDTAVENNAVWSSKVHKLKNIEFLGRRNDLTAMDTCVVYDD
jgi:hypothetical protein